MLNVYVLPIALAIFLMIGFAVASPRLWRRLWRKTYRGGYTQAQLGTVFSRTTPYRIEPWKRTRKKPCKADAHNWASIVAPYAQQCRTCGQVTFKEDDKGIFPDGLKEYVGMMLTLGQLPEPIPARNLCHCGKLMIIRARCDTCDHEMIRAFIATKENPYQATRDCWYCPTCQKSDGPNTGLGPIWFCEACESWKKAE